MTERIVLVLSAGIGDLFLAIPALRAVRRKYPSAKIWLLSSAKAAGYAKICSGADRVLSMPDGPALSHPFKILGLLWSLRRFRPDVAVNLYEVSTAGGDRKMRQLFSLMAPKISYGRRGPRFGSFFNKYVVEGPDDHKTQADYYAELIGMMGAEISPLDANDLPIGPEGEKAASRLLHGIPSGRPLVGLNPASARRSRHWLPQRFAELGDRLGVEHGCDIVILGGPADKSLAETVARRMKRRPIIAAGRLSIEGSLALMKKLDLLVTVHSSMMHAANILGTPYVCLAGPGNMVKDGPSGGDPAKRIIIPPGKDCAPCDRDYCHDHSCMEGIEVDTVYKAATALLWQKGK